MKFECKKAPEYYQLIFKYSMHDLMCDIINYCASSCAMGKIKYIRSNPNKNLKKRKDV